MNSTKEFLTLLIPDSIISSEVLGWVYKTVPAGTICVTGSISTIPNRESGTRHAMSPWQVTRNTQCIYSVALVWQDSTTLFGLNEQHKALARPLQHCVCTALVCSISWHPPVQLCKVAEICDLPGCRLGPAAGRGGRHLTRCCWHEKSAAAAASGGDLLQWVTQWARVKLDKKQGIFP